MMIVDRFRELRTSRKLSQKDLAQALNVSQQTVASWECGRTEPSNEYLKSIADYFNVSADYLLGRESSGCSLSSPQKVLLSVFDGLNGEGQNTMMVVLRSLKMSHPKKQKENAGNVINSNNGNNYGSVGGNFNPMVNLA